MAVDLSQVPVFAIVATLVCLAGICMIVGNFHTGIRLIVEMMIGPVHMADPKDNFYDYLEVYHHRFLALALATAMIVVVVLLVDFLHTNAMYADEPACPTCVSVLPIMVLMVVVYIAAILWIWVFYRVERLLTLYTLLFLDCSTQNSKEHFIPQVWACRKYKTGYADLLPETKGGNICYADLQSFCTKYVNNIKPAFHMSAIGCVLIIASLACLLTLLAALLDLMASSNRDREESNEMESAINVRQ